MQGRKQVSGHGLDRAPRSVLQDCYVELISFISFVSSCLICFILIHLCCFILRLLFGLDLFCLLCFDIPVLLCYMGVHKNDFIYLGISKNPPGIIGRP